MSAVQEIKLLVGFKEYCVFKEILITSVYNAHSRNSIQKLENGIFFGWQDSLNMLKVLSDTTLYSTLSFMQVKGEKKWPHEKDILMY